tara:strand:+ start:1132 stop:2388 length:1257 start_codon:yes stop_codon:yes gene_type:complete
LRVTRANLIFASLTAAFIRLFVFPLDDYPDIFFVYRRMIEFKLYFNIANYVDLFDLFKSYSCRILTPADPILDYLVGGGTYKCENFPLSFTYIYFFLIAFAVFVLIIFSFYKLSGKLKDLEKELFRRTILNSILLPSTLFFLLSFHVDVPYHFLTYVFVFASYLLAFQKRLRILLPIFILPFTFLILIAPDNQLIIFGGLLITAAFSHYLSKQSFILKIFDKISYQFSKIADLKLLVFKKSFLNYVFVSIIIISSIVLSSNKILEFLGTNVSLETLGEIYKIARMTIKINEIDDSYNTPTFLRLLGIFQGIVILTPFGIKPTIITTLLFFSSFFTGLIRTFSLKNSVFPVFIKIFMITSFLLILFVISLFPFFSYVKYWFYLVPFAALFMSLTPTISFLSFVLIYFELVLKSHWVPFL